MSLILRRKLVEPKAWQEKPPVAMIKIAQSGDAAEELRRHSNQEVARAMSIRSDLIADGSISAERRSPAFASGGILAQSITTTNITATNIETRSIRVADLRPVPPESRVETTRRLFNWRQYVAGVKENGSRVLVILFLVLAYFGLTIANVYLKHFQ